MCEYLALLFKYSFPASEIHGSNPNISKVLSSNYSPKTHGVMDNAVDSTAGGPGLIPANGFFSLMHKLVSKKIDPVMKNGGI